MPRDAVRPDLTAFRGVDQADDPAALIAFLEASDRVPSIVAVKSVMLKQLRPENARAALDVGCGFGTDVAELLHAVAVPGGTSRICRGCWLWQETGRRESRRST